VIKVNSRILGKVNNINYPPQERTVTEICDKNSGKKVVPEPNVLKN
jgi:hypothetical protein